MAKWEELDMADRAAYMRIAVKNGYRDIRSIREAYNKYGDGGDKGQSRPTDFRRVRENDTLATKKESTAMEDDINRRQKTMYYTAKNKGYDSKDYYIPYIPEKEIKVPGVGRVSSNMLDSIAVNAERAGISLVDAIGLAARETKFGAIPNYSLKARKDAYFKKHGKEMPEDVIKATERTALNSSVARNFGGIHPQFLINDHEWHTRGWNIKELDNIASPLEHGFRLYKTGNYNRGESGHTAEVKKAGNAAFNTDVVQKWYKEYKSKNKKNNGGNLFDDGGYKWKALNNIDYEAIPDTTFTRDKTGAGSIEYFQKEYPEGVTYPNGYHKPHPKPGKDVILYDPNTNDEQDIRLDALHIMPKDATYDVLNSIYRKAAKNSDVSYNAKSRYQEDATIYGKENIDSYEQYFNNEADGLLRNMFIEGTPEYIASKRYYPDKAQLKEWNKHILPEIEAIQQYLETGERPPYVLPEIVITPNKKK